MVPANLKEIDPYKFRYNAGFMGNYGKLCVIRYRNNPKMLKIYIYILRYGPFSESQMLAKLILYLKICSVPSESLITRLNTRTTFIRKGEPSISAGAHPKPILVLGECVLTCVMTR